MKIDVTLPHNEDFNRKNSSYSQTIFSIIEIFGNLNYSVEAGPDIESDFNNFSALNIPPHHPAREMQDTFYVNNPKIKCLEHIQVLFKLEQC